MRSSTAFMGICSLCSCWLSRLVRCDAYSVSRRTNEIGIRTALGAGRGTVIAMVVSETMRLVGMGMLVGLVAAWAATRLITNALFGLAPMDPITVATTVV